MADGLVLLLFSFILSQIDLTSNISCWCVKLRALCVKSRCQNKKAGMIQLLFKGLIWRTQKFHSTQGSETQSVVGTCAHEQLWQPLSEPDNCFKTHFSSTFSFFRTRAPKRRLKCHDLLFSPVLWVSGTGSAPGLCEVGQQETTFCLS